MSRRAAFLADIHGNLPALESVLEDIERRGIQEIYFLGDVMGKGPSVHEPVELLRKKCTGAVYGNWDRLVLKMPDAEKFGTPFYSSRLTDGDREWLSALPETLELSFCGRSVLCYHGRFSIPMVVTPMFNNTRENVETALYRFGEHDITIMADAHHPFLFDHQGHYLMNTGAVGNPCDKIPQASYLVLNDDDGIFSTQHIRVPYDIERAVSIANATPELPMSDVYIAEIRTARYGRNFLK